MTKNLNVSTRASLILTLVATLLCMLGAAPAVAAPAAPTGLSPDGSSVSGNPVLQWSHVSAATSYNVEVASSSAFDSLLYSVTTTNRRATPYTQLPAGPLWWRVRSVSSAGASDWATANWDKNPLTGPAPISPDPGTPLLQPQNPPVLRWQPVSGATSYQVEIDLSPGDFIDATAHQTQTTSLAVPNPQAKGVYVWRLRATLGTGIYTDWSEPRDYAIGPLPTVADASPGNDPDTAVEDVVFDWDPVPGAISYDIQVDDDDSFSAPIDTRTVKGTRYSPAFTYDNDQYWWRVRARNIFGEAEEWTEVPVRQFRRAWSPTPTLLHPADAISPAARDDLYFQWTPVRLATRYRLDIGPDANFSPLSYESCYTTETTYTPGRIENGSILDKCMPEPGETYFWRVQALDGPRLPQVNGIYSQARQFVYDPGRVTLSAPANDAVVDVPTLTWQPAQDAVAYKVTLTWSGGSKTVTTKSYSWTPTGTVSLDPARGPFQWRVQSIERNGDVSPLPFAARSFGLTGNLPTTGAAPLTPLAPAVDAEPTPRVPTLTWEPNPDARYYKIHIATNGSDFFKTLADKFPYPAGSDIESTYLQPGSYDWFVTAHDSGGAQIDVGDTVGTFQVSGLAAVAGQQVALHGSGLDTAGTSCQRALSAPLGEPRICTAMRGTPVLDWQPVPDAGYYMVYVSRDREFTNMVYGSKAEPTKIPSTQNTRWNPVAAMADSQAGDAYYWFIRPCKALTACAADPTSATHAFDKRSHSIEHLAPANGASVADDVTFEWRDYLATNRKPENADETTGELSSQAAQSYHLQVSASEAFTTMVDEVTVDQATYTAWNKTYPEGRLYWRVQVVDGANNKLTWTEPWSFTKASPAPTPISPAGGATASTTPPFRWRPLNFAASYDFELYKNGDESASPTNRVVSANSKQVAFTTTSPLPVAETPYVWRVRRVDADGRKGAWSTWQSFRVTGNAPTVDGPAEGAAVIGNQALFGWEPVAGAASYRFERRATGSTGLSESQTTVGLAWAPTRTISDGSWQWRVTALDARAAAVGSSSWRSFTVTTPTPDTTPPRVLSKSPTTNPSRTANFKATFSEPVQGVRPKTMKLFVTGRNTPLAAAVTLSTDMRTATLNPAANLQAGKTYTVRLSSTITDLSGNPLAATSWSVRVG